MEEFGSAVSNTVSSVSDQLSSIFNLTGSARDEANQMLADFFSSKNISKDALDILTAILKLKNMISSQSSTATASMAQNTDTSSYPAENTSDDSSDRIAVAFSKNSEAVEDITKDFSVDVIPFTEPDTDIADSADTDAADTSVDTDSQS